MSLSKNQQIVFAALGVWGVAVAGVGYLYWSALSDRQQAQQDFSDAEAKIDEFYSRPVFPEKKSIDAVKTNEQTYAEWREKAILRAAEGDRTYAPVSGSQFKQHLQTVVGRLAELPGGTAEGKLAAPNFGWSFADELQAGAKLPDLEETPLLQARLGIVADLAELMSESGVVELRQLSYLPPPKAPVDPRARRNKKPAAEPEFDKMDFSAEFLARPPAVVAVLNALAGDDRFSVVTSLSMRSSDPEAFAKRLAGPEEKENEAAGGRRGRRGRRHVVQEETEPKEEDAQKSRIITDPETDPPVFVSIKFSVYDFRKGVMGADPKPRKSAKKKAEPVEEAPAGAEAPAEEAPAPAEAEAPAEAPAEEPAVAPDAEPAEAPAAEGENAPVEGGN